jgi:hypothetical protein
MNAVSMLIYNTKFFNNSCANQSRGMGMYIPNSISYPRTAIMGCCSTSQQAKIILGSSTDLSRLLPNCANYTDRYVATSSFYPPGNDNNDCTLSSPCLTLSGAMGSINASVLVLECAYVSSPVTIG